MHRNNRWPTEPPVTGYTRSAGERRRLRLDPAILVPSAAVLLITVIAVGVVLQDSPARGAADHAAVIAKPTAVPGIPVPSRNSPEYSPPVPDHLPGDGMWLVGKQVKPGVYRSTAGIRCYWERLAGLSGKYVDLLDNGGFRNGPTLVQILAADFAFTSQGCGAWERVSDR